MVDQMQGCGKGLEDRQLVPLEAGQGQLLHQLVEAGDEPMPQVEAVLAGQSVQDRD